MRESNMCGCVKWQHSNGVRTTAAAHPFTRLSTCNFESNELVWCAARRLSGVSAFSPSATDNERALMRLLSPARPFRSRVQYVRTAAVRVFTAMAVVSSSARSRSMRTLSVSSRVAILVLSPNTLTSVLAATKSCISPSASILSTNAMPRFVLLADSHESDMRSLLRMSTKLRRRT